VAAVAVAELLMRRQVVRAVEVLEVIDLSTQRLVETIKEAVRAGVVIMVATRRLAVRE
jgi:predicted peroxiredoxin